MPDIAMCVNHECIDREQCYRYRCVPDERGQSYMSFDGPADGKKCSHFAVIWDGTKTVPMSMIPHIELRGL